MRPQLEDLSERPRIDVELEGPLALLKGAAVLVTGAGGSIGTVLSRRLVGAGPACLILVESSENALHRLLVEMDSPREIRAVLGDATHGPLLEELLRHYRPRYIFHVAAFKQVPLLESQPLAAVANNVLGTWRLAEAARRHGVCRLVTASTDKAVYPESVMGVSKRLADLLLLAWDAPRATSVRLGNVWGSRGSVVPRFTKLLQSGKPLVVTDPEATRYFMTVEEAVDLLIAALDLGRGGDILVPDLEPALSILSVAKHMAGEGHPIRFTRLRPGDKLHEQLFYDTEREYTRSTPSGSIRRIVGPRPARAEVLDRLRELESLVARGDARTLLERLEGYWRAHGDGNLRSAAAGGPR